MKAEYDVIVFGGGTAGVIAAIQAARAGVSTLLVEKNGMLGGTMTVAGINAPAHFFAWGRQIIAGIGWELVRLTYEQTGRDVPVPEISDGKPKVPHLTVDVGVFAAVCDMAVLQAGAEMLMHAMPAAAEFDGRAWAVTICTKTGLQGTRAKVLIDATGDANVVGLAGCELVLPDVVQPATLQMRCGGYDPKALDYDAIKVACDRAIAAGELKLTDVAWDQRGPGAFLRKFGRNANHVRAPQCQTSEGRTAAEIEARQSLLRMYRFFRRQEGLEGFRIESVCSELGIRETATIKGKQTITVEDYRAGRVYDDALCYAFYPIDEHLNDGGGINYHLLESGVVATVPRGALLPAASSFLIAAGRCVSSDRLANSALRVECPCMAMGQAAGAMAALSAAKGVDAEDLPLDDIRSLLRDHGAIVPQP